MALIAGAVELAELGVMAVEAAGEAIAEADYVISEAGIEMNRASYGIGQYGGYAGLPLVAAGALPFVSKKKRKLKEFATGTGQLPEPEDLPDAKDVPDEMDIDEKDAKEDPEDAMNVDIIVRALGGTFHVTRGPILTISSRMTKVDFSGYTLVEKQHTVNGGYVADTEGVLIGVGPCTSHVYDGLYEGIVAALFHQAGIDYNYDEAIEGKFFIKYQFHKSYDTIALTTATTSVVTNGLLTNLKDQLKGSVHGAITTNEAPKFIQFSLWQQNASGDASDDSVLVSRLNALGLKIGISQNCTMILQNQTEAGTTVVGDGDQHQVDRNPLYGKVYYGKGNYLIEKFRATGSASPIKFDTDGYFRARVALQFDPEHRAIDDKFQNAKVSKGFHLQPSKMMKIKAGFEAKHTINVWFKKLITYVNTGAIQTTFANPVDFGEFKVIQFDRAIKSLTNEAHVKVAYENTVNTFSSYKYDFVKGYMTLRSETTDLALEP